MSERTRSQPSSLTIIGWLAGITPIIERDTREMIREIKTFKLLTVVRGRETADIEDLVKLNSY